MSVAATELEDKNELPTAFVALKPGSPESISTDIVNSTARQLSPGFRPGSIPGRMYHSSR